jgi:hypothetical protein
MRRILLMVFALAMFMGLATTGAMAADKSGHGKECKYGKLSLGTCKPKPPKDCKYGTYGSGKCKPKPPEECKYGVTVDHQCMPKPDECPPFGMDDHGECKPPVVVPPPEHGPCAKADLVLLEDLIKGSGALVCLYLGDNSPNASNDKDCAGALIALPVDNLVGACVFLPPADVGDSPSPNVGAVSTGTPLTSTGPLSGLLSPLAGLLKMG